MSSPESQCVSVPQPKDEAEGNELAKHSIFFPTCTKVNLSCQMCVEFICQWIKYASCKLMLCPLCLINVPGIVFQAEHKNCKV